eukprot:CAMPEP_0185585624 /NCGR_PEP_ID=MMETSP0434-20130131/39802_1 /TAXON_ID=626734 ORGANISM="Favella taraikaensis, Strain Fe Narragansett Bay" /NCGR_SAMPLE_ID=MMETSP0434 /ASSEMBLY_ACC=CAM_ASM_000379 /LENGTH=68 /DNA_ID=CAMNT_0028206081 /DNA_START=933 /DNA_END=1136 /DNA_ORIENTATION=-
MKRMFSTPGALYGTFRQHRYQSATCAGNKCKLLSHPLMSASRWMCAEAALYSRNRMATRATTTGVSRK